MQRLLVTVNYHDYHLSINYEINYTSYTGFGCGLDIVPTNNKKGT